MTTYTQEGIKEKAKKERKKDAAIDVGQKTLDLAMCVNWGSHLGEREGSDLISAIREVRGDLAIHEWFSPLDGPCCLLRLCENTKSYEEAGRIVKFILGKEYDHRGQVHCQGRDACKTQAHA